jgi:hypothetical protein
MEWHEVSGSSDGGMEVSKLAGRIENAEWGGEISL